MDKHSKLLAIDPAFGGTGCAVFKGRYDNLTATFTFKSVGKRPFEDRAKEIALKINDAVLDFEITHVVVEFPVFMNTPSRSMGWVKGDLQKLTFLVGMIGGVIRPEDAVFSTVPVPTWKGQLSKELVIKRIKKRIPFHILDALAPVKDEWDAIGIGLWAYGQL